jgi:hypothetical protein
MSEVNELADALRVSFYECVSNPRRYVGESWALFEPYLTPLSDLEPEPEPEPPVGPGPPIDPGPPVDPGPPSTVEVTDDSTADAGSEPAP